VPNASDVRQIEIHTAEPLVPGLSHIEVEIAIVKLKKYKSPGSDEIPAELIQATVSSFLILPNSSLAVILCCIKHKNCRYVH
jgi:hypothetical protein